MADKEGNLDAVLKEAVDLVTTGFLLRRFLGCSGMSGQGSLWAYLYSWISGSTGGFISWFLLSWDSRMLGLVVESACGLWFGYLPKTRWP